MTVETSYQTKQRNQILDCLIKNKDRHITADEIMNALNGEKPLVGKTTVYRYLDNSWKVSSGFSAPEKPSRCLGSLEFHKLVHG